MIIPHLSFLSTLGSAIEKKVTFLKSSQDSSVGSMLDWYSKGPGFESRHLKLNFQLEKGCVERFSAVHHKIQLGRKYFKISMLCIVKLHITKLVSYNLV